MKQEQKGRIRRHERLRKKITGTLERPRLAIYKSHKGIYAQLIDDMEGKTLLSLSTMNLPGGGGNIKAAIALGDEFAKRAVVKDIKKVTFDRGGYLYHGSVKAFADAVRKAGLDF